MAPPFIALDLDQFGRLLAEWSGGEVRHRRVNAVHLHHSARAGSGFRGHETMVELWRAHTDEQGLTDIAQHIVIDPRGNIWTGRHWDRPPASARGHNGNLRIGPFAIALYGDFNTEAPSEPQLAAAEWAIAQVLDAFGLDAAELKLQRDLGEAGASTSPGAAIAKDPLVAAVGDKLRGLAKPADQRSATERPPAATRRGSAGSYDPLGEARRWLAADASGIAEEGGDAEPDAAPLLSATNRRALGRPAPERALDADALAALRPHVINLTAGRLSDAGDYTTGPDDLARIFDDALPGYIAACARAGRPPRLVLFAHGGLTSEVAGLLIALNQVDWWTRNHVYPLFFVWETGLFEEIGRILGGVRAATRELTDFSDRLIENTVRRPVGRIWRAMKADAEAAFVADRGGGGLVVAERLAALAKNVEALQVHAVGHSAGSIFHSWLLPDLAARGITARTISLLAPAITVADYRARLERLVDGDTRLALFTMAKDYERADTVTTLYRKSLLYLLMHALEAREDEPILGLDECLRADPLLRAHFGLQTRTEGDPPAPAEVIFSKTRGLTGRSESQSISHGGFDNDPATMDSVLRRILDWPDASTLPYPFPADPVSRAVPGVSIEPPEVATATGASPPPAVTAMPAPGNRRALCIGIDAYPDPRARLFGCVADARAWAAALGELGYSVESLHDAAATRDAIIERLKTLVTGARAGDSLVFQFAGHGTQLPDNDTDESEDAKDEAFCAFDYLDGNFVIDDDFRGLFDAIPAGVGVTAFFDCCHSGTITRLGIGRDDPEPTSRPRFLVAPPEAVAKFRARAAAATGARAAHGSRDNMRHVVFAACTPEQVALESNGRGDFSTRAIPLLRSAPTLTNAAFRDAVLRAFGPAPKQLPNLDTAPGLEQGRLLFLDAAPAAPGVAPRAAQLAEVAALLERAAGLVRSA